MENLTLEQAFLANIRGRVCLSENELGEVVSASVAAVVDSRKSLGVYRTVIAAKADTLLLFQNARKLIHKYLKHDNCDDEGPDYGDYFLRQENGTS